MTHRGSTSWRAARIAVSQVARSEVDILERGVRSWKPVALPEWLKELEVSIDHREALD